MTSESFYGHMVQEHYVRRVREIAAERAQALRGILARCAVRISGVRILEVGVAWAILPAWDVYLRHRGQDCPRHTSHCANVPTSRIRTRISA